MEYSQFSDENRVSTMQQILRRLHIDLPLLLSLLLLSAIGLFVLYSAGDQNQDLIARQLVRLLIGFVFMFAIAQISPAVIQRWAPWVFGIGLLMLIAVLLLGEVGKGAQRWLSLGFFRFQPSEIMKIAVPIMIAWYLADAVLP
ncbi:MAG: FtsW/RodA/SpoVE family cell cycle protein, partial [Thioalkalispiraceae bacterium]